MIQWNPSKINIVKDNINEVSCITFNSTTCDDIFKGGNREYIGSYISFIDNVCLESRNYKAMLIIKFSVMKW